MTEVKRARAGRLMFCVWQTVKHSHALRLHEGIACDKG